LAGAATVTPLLARTAHAGAVFGAAAPAAVEPEELPWPQARTIVAETKVPAFPDVTFDVTKYGAKGDGSTDNTNAFKAAIDACNAAGGGHVIVPSGTYVTGAVYLKSNVDLHLNSGSTLKFSGTASRYPTVLTRFEGIECMNRSPMIYAYKERNIALTGSGTLDASGTSSWNKGNDRAWLESLIKDGVTDPRKRIVPGSGHNVRVAFVEPNNCDTVLIQGIKLKGPQFWQMHPVLCKNVTIDGISTDPSTARSQTDGCNPESCDHVVIKNCTLGAHDDNIAIKSGRDEDGRRINVPSQNIVVFGCTMIGNWGAITCGSEMTGGVRNVYAYKVTVKAAKFALYIKTNTRRGGFAENINLDSFSGVFDRAFAHVRPKYNDQTGSHVPTFGTITITNSTCSKAAQAFDISGLPNSHVKGLTVRDCSFNGVANTKSTLTHVDNISFTNVKINGKTVPG
jgi:polygalacturonase